MLSYDESFVIFKWKVSFGILFNTIKHLEIDIVSTQKFKRVRRTVDKRHHFYKYYQMAN